MIYEKKNISKAELTRLLEYNRSKKVRDNAFQLYPFSRAREVELVNLSKWAKDSKVRKKAKEEIEKRIMIDSL